MKTLLYSYFILFPFLWIAYLIQDLPIAASSVLGFGFTLVIIYLINKNKKIA